MIRWVSRGPAHVLFLSKHFTSLREAFHTAWAGLMKTVSAKVLFVDFLLEILTTHRAARNGYQSVSRIDSGHANYRWNTPRVPCRES